MKVCGRVALDGLRTSVVLLGIGLLVTGCGGGGGDQVPQTPMQEAMPGDGTGSSMTRLGAWNAPMPGGLDVSDANNVLRAYYGPSGGQVMAGAPVQPEGTGTATWTGMWSGKIDIDPAALPALSLIGVTADDFQALSGGAVVTVYFAGGGDEADLTYEDIGLDDFGLSELTSGRVPLSGGTFRPTVTHSIRIPLGVAEITATGAFAGEGVFGGANAEGVAGYVSGDISAPELGTGDLGSFKSVFYGDEDSN